MFFMFSINTINHVISSLSMLTVAVSEVFLAGEEYDAVVVRAGEAPGPTHYLPQNDE
jgi:hypothetical protein